jgi:hypothetical protein
MKFFLDFNDFVLEGKIDGVYTKYYSDVEPDIFIQIVASDPTSRMNDSWTPARYKELKAELHTAKSEERPVEEVNKLKFRMLEEQMNSIKKVGIYCKWLLKIYKQEKLLIEDLYKATEYLEAFDKNKHNIKASGNPNDINQYKELTELYDVIRRYSKPDDSLIDENELVTNEYYINMGMATKHFEDEKFLVIIPVQYEASKYYATNTQWCTRFPGQYENYSKKDDLYIIINKELLNSNSDMRRIQFHFESRQFMDVRDKRIKFQEFIAENPQLFRERGRLLKFAEDELTTSEVDDIFQTEYSEYTPEEKNAFGNLINFNKISSESVDVFLRDYLDAPVEKLAKMLSKVPKDKISKDIVDHLSGIYDSLSSINEKLFILPYMIHILPKTTIDEMFREVKSGDTLSKVKFLMSIDYLNMLRKNPASTSVIIDMLESMSEKGQIYILTNLIDNGMDDDLRQPPLGTILKRFKPLLMKIQMLDINDTLTNTPYEQLTAAILERVKNKIATFGLLVG